MQQAIVGTKYQIVIPKEIRDKLKDFRPGSKVIIKNTDADTIIVKPTKRLWSDETYGFMKEAWNGIDPIAEIEKMRNEWDEKRE